MIKLRQILVKNEGNQGIRSQAMLPPSVCSMEFCHNAAAVSVGSVRPLPATAGGEGVEALGFRPSCSTHAIHLILHSSGSVAPIRRLHCIPRSAIPFRLACSIP